MSSQSLCRTKAPTHNSFLELFHTVEESSHFHSSTNYPPSLPVCGCLLEYDNICASTWIEWVSLFFFFTSLKHFKLLLCGIDLPHSLLMFPESFFSLNIKIFHWIYNKTVPESTSCVYSAEPGGDFAPKSSGAVFKRTATYLFPVRKPQSPDQV